MLNNLPVLASLVLGLQVYTPTTPTPGFFFLWFWGLSSGLYITEQDPLHPELPLQLGIFISLFFEYNDVTDGILFIFKPTVSKQLLALSRCLVCSGWKDAAGSPLLLQYPHFCI